MIYKPKVYHCTSDGIYHEYNQWCFCDFEDSWFVRFLRHNFPNNKKRINFFGPVGNPFVMHKKYKGFKIFYTPEDVEHRFTKLWLYYRHYGMDYMDLAMGFGDLNNSKYLRFPFWILTTFQPTDSEQEIINRIKDINCRTFQKTRDCVLICSHDPKGTRKMIFDGVKDVLKISSAGRWRNNTRELWEEYNNDKLEYMTNFRFNICAENDNTENYVTEKIFDAFLTGCIPIYYGSNNNPEPGLINKDAVIFWKKGGNNANNLSLIKSLNSNQKLYTDFISQPKLSMEACEYVINRFRLLKERIKAIIE